MVARQILVWGVAAAGVAAFQVALAQPVRSCPDGQAVQSLHPNGTPVQCVPVPAPVDIAPLMQAIVQESAERKQADAEIRASINEASIVGRYAFSGTQMCLSSSRGFDGSFTPIMPPVFVPAPPPPPPPPVVFPPGVPLPTPTPTPTPPPSAEVPQPPIEITFVAQSTASVTGFRTFRADGTGTLELEAININYPGIVYTRIQNLQNGFVSTNAAVSSGLPSAVTSKQQGSFRWQILDGKLIIEDDGGVTGRITAGGTRVNWIVEVDDVPRQVGVLGKDLKTITLSTEGPGVEKSVLISPPEVTPAQRIETPRICLRDRVLRKL